MNSSKLLSFHKKEILVFLFSYMLFASIVAVALDFNALEYIFVSWTLPSAYFVYRIRTFRTKILLTSLAWSIPGSITIDLVGHESRAWSYWENLNFASSGISIFSIPIESFIWGVSFWLFYTSLYEFFYDKKRKHSYNKILYIILAVLYAYAALLLILINYTDQFSIDYFFIGILGMYSLINAFFLTQVRISYERLASFVIISFLLGIIVEITSLSLGLWEFPDAQFILTFNFWGTTVPIEEILWWAVLPLTILLTHELFNDNSKSD